MSHPRRAVAAVADVTAWGVNLPGLDPAAVAGVDLGSAVEPHSAREVLGRKGLLAKDPATRLALCAVHRALGRPAGAARPAGEPDPRTAVVASSNLGNVAVVRAVMAVVAATGGRDVSPLDAPNVSSNVIASSVALWFRWGGPALTICSGATSGLDAVAVALRLLQADRADRVVVVGAEPGDPVAQGLNAGRQTRGAGQLPLREGAACIVLEPVGAGGVGATRIGPVRPVQDGPPEVDRADVVVGPSGSCDGAGGIRVHPEQLGGDSYGAAGVLHAALATAMVVAGGSERVLAVCGDLADGWRSAWVAGPQGGDPR